MTQTIQLQEQSPRHYIDKVKWLEFSFIILIFFFIFSGDN